MVRFFYSILKNQSLNWAKILKRSLQSLCLLVMVSTSLFSAHSQTPGGLVQITPGSLFKQAGSDVLVLDKGWRLVWSSTGPLSLINAQGQVLAQTSLNQRPQELGRTEAHGLELEEADLGSGKGGRYLQGKKQPKGRSFQTQKLSSETPAAEKPQVTQQQVQGIPLITKQFANGSKILEWHWGKTVESVFLDRRDTLVWVQQEKTLPEGKLSLQQWSDGSFTRRLEKPQGSFAYTWDSLSSSARLVFSNAQGQVVSEFGCDSRSCEES